jgi:hypothetical protein
MGRKKKSARSRRRPVATPNAAVNWPLITTVAVVVVAVAVIAGTLSAIRLANAPPVTPTPTTLAQRVDGIPCNNDDIVYHEHAFLAILDGGRNVQVPANIGIVDNTCVYYLHTHDNSGEIHMEAPSFQPFTLGNFFDVWGTPLSRQNVAGHVVGTGQTMRVYVNGKIFAGDPRNIPLRRHVRITLEIGPPFKPAQGFDFQGD